MNGDFFSLTNKNIIITGASSGIGRAIAIKCSMVGANIMLIGRNIKNLHQTKNMLSSGNHYIITLDLLETNEIQEVISQAIIKMGKISGFVHSAGCDFIYPLKMMKPKHYKPLFDLNVISGFELARMITKKANVAESGASLIFIASVMGVVGTASKVGYCATKGAVISGVRAMALELAKQKIRVNCISPGQILDTEMTDRTFASLSDAAIESIKASHPLGLGTADDVSMCAVFLLSSAGRWITGTNLIVDGGYSAG